MQEEQDTCRICSAPAEPDQPLFYPCKCSGTIRYIHQDCLTEWLAHSKKKTCDVCKHPYSFTKVYSQDMPDRLPFLLVLRQFSRQVVSAILFTFRATLVATVWLAALPWATIWTWRMYFALGNSAAWWISALSRPQSDVDFYHIPLSNTTTNTTAETTANITSSEPIDIELLTLKHIFAHPVYKALSSDIFSGQIIASIIVLTFVAIFLLREWISQNARPGIFEEGDAQMDVGAAPEAFPPIPGPPQPLIAVQQPLLAPPQPPRPPSPAPVLPHPVQDPGRSIKDHHYDGVRDDIAFQTRVKKPRTRRDRSPEPPILHVRGTRRPVSAREERKSKGHQVGRVRRANGDHSEEDNLAYHRDKNFRRLRYVASRMDSLDGETGKTILPPKSETPKSPEREHDGGGLPIVSDFTFTVPGPAFPSPSSAKGKEPAVPRANFVIPYNGNGHGSLASPPRSLQDNSSDEDERDRTPTRPSTPVLASASSSTFSLKLNGSGLSTAPPVASPNTTLPNLRRPPLPSVSLPPSPIPSSSTAAILASSRGQTPLGSPSLATYHAPEELSAESSVGEGSSYFAHEPSTRVMEKERRRYFREPDEEAPLVNEAGADEADDDETDDEWDGEQRGRRAQDEDLRRAATEMAEMADGEMDDEPDDVQWTDEEVAREEDEDDDGDEGVVQIRDEVAQALAVPPLADAGAPADGPPAAAPERREVRVVMGQPPELPPQDDFDADGNIEDDMDGALEDELFAAIGLRGPLVGVLQNAVLMTFILDTTIGLGIWLPFTIGKVTALLTLNPRRALQLLHLPLRMIRLITDPVVDTVLLIVSRGLVPPLARFGQVALKQGLDGVANVVGQDRTDKLTRLSTAAYGRIMQVANEVFERTEPSATMDSDIPEPQSSAGYLYRVLEEDTTVMRLVEPYFAPIGKNVQELSAEGKTTWIRLATGDTPNDRAFAILLGYAVVGLLLAIYLNVLTVGSMRSAGRAVRNAVRQQLLVVKVAAFIIIELVIFPLGCGMMLDVCTVWLFPHGSFRSRAAFLMYAPLTAVFYHWVLGTMFMYQFAVLLSGCRGIMRAGAMWFIKDPQDQNFHPIRDILERPTFVQIRKLFLSAIMYGFVVASGVATVSSILRIFSRTIMPFRWKIREPLSEVPIDLILLQLVLPYTMDSFRPRKAFRRFGIFFWKYLASRLRLSSYMFGGRYPTEEFTPTHWSWRSLLIDDGMQMDDAEANHDGCFRRVPNSDNIALVRDSPATVEVLEDGTPVNEEARKLIDAQNAEAQKAKRVVKNDYTVVYLPPNVRYRVIVFLLALWTIGSLMIATILAAPILLGRGFFRLFIPHDVHDGYSSIVGFYLLWGCWLVGSSLDRMDKRRQRRWGDSDNRADWPLFVAKRTLLWVAQALYMALMLGIVIPTLVGLVFELYIIQPIRHTAHPLVEPRIRMVDMWALGLLYSKIVVRSFRMQPPAPGPNILRGIDRILRNGWVHLDPLRATTEVIAPLTGGLLGMIIFPAGIVWGITRLVTLPIDGDFLFLHVYPGIFTLAGLAQAGFALSRVMGSWSQTIRDKEFLVEMRLRNLEPEPEKRNVAVRTESKGEVLTEVDEP